MKLTDKEAIERIKNGEIDIFSQIVNEYSSKINAYIKAKLFNKLEVDDLVQNTFISFYKALFHFDDTKPVLPYLYQIARNELKMYYRSRK
ncbi:MAG: sigma-70 family RNA polymerase sigma factor, partial [bacterium]|nr:sigma-70 family RNA polymerase sigma factor [bacterium]